MLRTPALLAAALLSFAGTARADWQFTKWGMSVDQLVSASGGKAVRIPPDQIAAKSPPKGPLRCLAEVAPPYRIGSTDFDSGSFLFDANGRLAAINFSVRADKFDELQSQLTAALGRPSASESRVFPHLIWRDLQKHNAVELRGFGTITILSYAPIPSDF